MHKESAEPILSAVFVDYDNVYLSLKRKSEEAAKRFAKDATGWIAAIASGQLITPTNALPGNVNRRLVMNRCYGNPVPRRNTSDNTTDMNSFAFVRHHFLRSGFEIIDCPPLTAQLKNSSDIRMVMDIRDYLDHKTNFDEFIILSSDADFTPVLHRLRSHAKRTVIFANDNTVAPYTALSDGEVREADLIAHLQGDRMTMDHRTALPAGADTLANRDLIIDQVVQAVLEADRPVPLEALAERATRVLGHDRTVGSAWAGAGSFRELLLAELPGSIKLTNEPPYLAFEAARALSNLVPETVAPPAAPPQPLPLAAQPAPEPAIPAQQPSPAAAATPAASLPPAQPPLETSVPAAAGAAAAATQPEPQIEQTDQIVAQDLHQSISRIHAACAAPPFSPPEYRALFAIFAQEISDNQLQGVTTLENVAARAAEIGISVAAEDARYVLDAISDGDPWFEQGATAALFAGRFRNYVVGRCHKHGLNLSVAELDLIDAWFAASPKVESPQSDLLVGEVEPARSRAQQGSAMQPATPSAMPVGQAVQPPAAPQPAASPAARQSPAMAVQQGQPGGPDWWRSGGDQPVAAGQQPAAAVPGQPPAPATAAGVSADPVLQGADADDFPRIVRNRLRG